ncbi:hypothetical protein ACXYTJ_07710 [Gilvimarinus sp. F26214L]|uniref:hypothetical protein n=1 Tax=Gilvimarinus sp. DZF01 TaxID=3461371 RepID=UPI004045CD68
MNITYTRREFGADGLGEREGPYTAPLGYFLFAEAACYFGVLPPYSMLNKTLGEGRLVSAGNMVLEWQPMRINRLQYEELKRSVQANPHWGGEVDDGFRGSRKYWERWAILRSLQKMSA